MAKRKSKKSRSARSVGSSSLSYLQLPGSVFLDMYPEYISKMHPFMVSEVRSDPLSVVRFLPGLDVVEFGHVDDFWILFP